MFSLTWKIAYTIIISGIYLWCGVQTNCSRVSCKRHRREGIHSWNDTKPENFSWPTLMNAKYFRSPPSSTGKFFVAPPPPQPKPYFSLNMKFGQRSPFHINLRCQEIAYGISSLVNFLPFFCLKSFPRNFEYPGSHVLVKCTKIQDYGTRHAAH